MPNGTGVGLSTRLVAARTCMVVLDSRMIQACALWWRKLLLDGYKRHNDTAVDDDTEQIIQEGEAAKTAALEYADWLVNTLNDSIPDEKWRVPVPHPCTLNVADIGDTNDDDYHDIVNTVHRHTRCSPAYCTVCAKARSARAERLLRLSLPTRHQLYNLRSSQMVQFTPY